MSRRSAPVVRIQQGTFAVVASGFAEGPSQALVRYLNERGAAEVTVVSHPLSPETPGDHIRERFEGGSSTHRSVRRMPHRPPLTYALDPFVLPRIGRVDAWIGFNCLATAEGLVRRSLGRAGRVIHWNVDFVPNRFGTSPLTAAYEWLDRSCCRAADGRVDLSQAALEGRARAYGLGPGTAPAEVIPMGSWLDDAVTTSEASLAAPRAVFLGHLVERMGVDTFIDAMALLATRGSRLSGDIVGGGPMLDHVRGRVRDLGLGERVVVHGFVPEFAQVQQILGRAAVAVAPYEVDESSFSRFADPGKLKAYLGAALPIVLTDVPPNAHELVAEGGAELVASDPSAFAQALDRIVTDAALWRERHLRAAALARRYDWGVLFGASLPRLGLE